MNKHLVKYKITPRVVKTGSEQTFKIKALDSSCHFFEGYKYNITIKRKDGWTYKNGEQLTYTGRNLSESLEVLCENGELAFTYTFDFEGEWIINFAAMDITPEFRKFYEDNGWGWHIDGAFSGNSFSIYALDEDLYNKRPFKGDMHIHTTGSDGDESPQMVAAEYRKSGYDFISITDHRALQPSLDAINIFKNIPTSFKIFPGEEIHLGTKGVFHYVNFNPKYSVNDIIKADFDGVEREVKELSKGIEADNDVDRLELAWFKWMYENAKKSGGIAIYPHPFYEPDGATNIRTSISNEIFRQGFMDVFEIFGGCSGKGNKMQFAMWLDHIKQGKNIPIVASTDSHSSVKRGWSNFNMWWTVVFAEDAESIPDNILEGNTVAVDDTVIDNKNIYGDLRLVRYSWFLMENYFDWLTPLCNASGQAMLRYIFGDESQLELVRLLENEIDMFKKNFFGN